MFKRKMKILQSIGALCVLTSMVCTSACSGGGNDLCAGAKNSCFMSSQQPRIAVV